MESRKYNNIAEKEGAEKYSEFSSFFLNIPDKTTQDEGKENLHLNNDLTLIVKMDAYQRNAQWLLNDMRNKRQEQQRKKDQQVKIQVDNFSTVSTRITDAQGNEGFTANPSPAQMHKIYPPSSLYTHQQMIVREPISDIIPKPPTDQQQLRVANLMTLRKLNKQEYNLQLAAAPMEIKNHLEQMAKNWDMKELGQQRKDVQNAKLLEGLETNKREEDYPLNAVQGLEQLQREGLGHPKLEIIKRSHAFFKEQGTAGPRLHDHRMELPN